MMTLEGIFVERARSNGRNGHEGISRETKMLILELMKEAGSLEWTLGVLRALEGVLGREVGVVEGIAAGDGMAGRNTVLRLLMERLKL